MKHRNPTPLLKWDTCPRGKQLIELAHILGDASGEVSCEERRIDELDGHILALADHYGVNVGRVEGPLSTLRCIYISNTQSLRVPWAVGQYTYFCGLHEVGHVVLGRPPAQTDEETFDEECEAWKWAFSNGKIKPSDQVTEYSGAFLDQYRHKCACNICGTQVEVRYEDDPQAYDALYQSMFG